MAKIALYATFRVLPEYRDTMQQLMTQLTQDVRSEPGNERFIAYTLAADPLSYHVDEIYADDTAFAAHIGSAHCAAFNRTITPMVEGGGSTVVFLNTPVDA